jgi:hypothetical protein
MVPKFDIHEIVAQSAESVVFAGEDLDAGAAMALRRYLARQDGKRGVADEANFFTEVGKVRGLEGEHVVGILEAGFDAQDQNPYFLTRLVDGEMLTKMLEGALLAEGDAQTIVVEALEGLQRLHEKGVVHGSLRPDRLRWSRTAGVWLTDAGMEPALLKLGDFKSIGEASTTAPELRKAGKRSGAGDFYALGATIYELLSGKPVPVDGPWPSLGGALARWDAWLKRMGAATPAGRPGNCAEALALFEAAMALAAEPASATDKPARKTSAPLLTRVAQPGAASAAKEIPPMGEWKPALNITGMAPAVALPSAKRQWISPVWVAAVVLLLAVGAGGYFLRNREEFSAMASRIMPAGKVPTAGLVPALAPPVPAAVADSSPIAAATAVAPASEVDVQLPPVEVAAPIPEPVAVAPAPEPPVVETIAPPPVVARRPAPVAEPAGGVKEFFGPRDTSLMLAQLGQPGVIRGTVQRLGGSKSGAYMDVLFHGGDGMAFIRTDPAVAFDAIAFQAFKGKTIEIRGVIDQRPWTNGRERPSIRFLSIDDVKIVAP